MYNILIMRKSYGPTELGFRILLLIFMKQMALGWMCPQRIVVDIAQSAVTSI